MPVEKQLLPNDALKPLYDKVVWVYNYNDFKGGDADRAATRTRMRLSVSSYPQLLLVEPATYRVVGQTGRSVESFVKAVNAARVTKPRDPKGSQAALVAAEKLAEQLHAAPSTGAAVKALASPDVAVRILALQLLAKEAPNEVAKRALKLLKTPNDLLRYEVCKVLATPGLKVPEPVIAQLEALVKTPEPSRNPNVLRINAVRALGQCGRAESLPVIAEFASTGNIRNGLTRIAVEAVEALARRHRATRPHAIQALIAGFPEPVEPGDRLERSCLALAKRLHAALVPLTRRPVVFPTTYDAAARTRLQAEFAGKR